MSGKNCYCAFCRLPRVVYRKKQLGLINMIQALGIALVLSFVFWQALDPRAMVIFFMALIFIEMGILIRSRADVACPHCGFDPVVYLRNQNQACEEVKKHLEGRKEDINVWLARKPPIRLPGRKKKSTRELIV